MGVYLDYNATAPLRLAAKAAMVAALDAPANPSSVHAYGQAARRRVETARAQVAGLVGADPARLLFCGSGTEANNMVLRGLPGRRLILSACAHASLLEAAKVSGQSVTLLPPDGNGRLEPAALADLLAADPQPALVAVLLANNETGAIQPVAALAEIAHAHGALLHCDAVQAAGRIAVDMARLGADSLVLSSHKLGGPAGVAALCLGPDLDPAPLLVGGGQERGRRAGTEAVAVIAGFGAACVAARHDPGEAERLRGLREGIEAVIRVVRPDAIFAAAGGARLPNTSCVILRGTKAETLLVKLDLAGVAVSAGAACSSGKMRPSHVLAAMGFSADDSASAIRISLGWASTPDDIDQFASAFAAAAGRAGGGIEHAA